MARIGCIVVKHGISWGVGSMFTHVVLDDNESLV